MPRPILVLAASVAALSIAMSASARQQPADADGPLPLKELMAHVFQRNAEQLWHWSAYEIDRDGEHSSRPQAEADWENAESDALTLQQLARALERPPYPVDDPRWAARAEGLRAAATASASAAERKDYEAFETANNTVNEQCIACHLAFAPELERVPASF